MANLGRTIAVNTNTNSTLVAAVAGTVVRVVSYGLSAGGATNFQFTSGNGVTNTALCGPMNMATGTPHYPSTPSNLPDAGRCLFQTIKGQALNLNQSTNAAIGGYVMVEECT